jgi:hypothetical protein
MNEQHIKIRYEAVFGDGEMVERKGSTRIYTHCWRAIRHFKPDERTEADRNGYWEGFARSEALAHKAGASYARYGYTYEVAPVTAFPA